MAETGKGSVAIDFVRQAAQALVRRGHDPVPVLLRCNIAPTLLLSDSARVTPESFGALWLAISAVLDDEFFALDARRMKVGSFSTLCHHCLNADNLDGVLKRMSRLFNILLDDTVMRVESLGAEAFLVLRSRPGREPELEAFAHETLLVISYGLLCWLVGRRVPIRRASFAYTQPAWWPEYRSIFCDDLQFGGTETCIVISARHLTQPVMQTAASAREFLRGAPANFILKYRDDQSLASRLRRRLRSLPPESWPNQATLAREFRLGSSTMHRKLAEEGTSLREIRDVLRRDLAVRHLAESGLSVCDIAAALGFAEPSAFRRAFKQWTGVRPGDYRRD
ncbi:AraC family transcriptional regulator [Nevskia soli]|uniref:AraC family transcriptional regulator n=1 Tax=Nevskia soli TaxID=418856 RepID=UPI0004A73AFF|nr:AraC family transcriptional regulator [Nevskia soli]